MVIPFFVIFIALLMDDDFPECSVKYLSAMSFRTLLFLYFLARAYLLVAIFISLCSVPAGVYQTVNWLAFYIPLCCCVFAYHTRIHGTMCHTPQRPKQNQYYGILQAAPASERRIF